MNGDICGTCLAGQKSKGALRVIVTVPFERTSSDSGSFDIHPSVSSFFHTDRNILSYAHHHHHHHQPNSLTTTVERQVCGQSVAANQSSISLTPPVTYHVATEVTACLPAKRLLTSSSLPNIPLRCTSANAASPIDLSPEWQAAAPFDRTSRSPPALLGTHLNEGIQSTPSQKSRYRHQNHISQLSQNGQLTAISQTFGCASNQASTCWTSPNSSRNKLHTAYSLPSDHLISDVLCDDADIRHTADAAKFSAGQSVTIVRVNPHSADQSFTKCFPTDPTISSCALCGKSAIEVHGVDARDDQSSSQLKMTSACGLSAKSVGALSNSSSSIEICRICHCESTADAPLIAPCYCCGSLKYVHQNCLQQWIKSSQTKTCEVCRFAFIMQTKLKPFRKVCHYYCEHICHWEKLDISKVERRKILCSVGFHVVAITCVMWSLYVLIDRTAEEISENSLDWPFWTKLIVVAIGFTGGLVFMYVQCKMYAELFARWRSFNKVIYVANGPGGQTLDGAVGDTTYSGEKGLTKDNDVTKAGRKRDTVIQIKA